MSLFEVRQHGVPKMSTDSYSCIYDLATLKSMQKAGCTFRVNGKAVQAKEVHAAVKAAEKAKGRSR